MVIDVKVIWMFSWYMFYFRSSNFLKPDIISSALWSDHESSVLCIAPWKTFLSSWCFFDNLLNLFRIHMFYIRFFWKFVLSLRLCFHKTSPLGLQVRWGGEYWLCYPNYSSVSFSWRLRKEREVQWWVSLLLLWKYVCHVGELPKCLGFCKLFSNFVFSLVYKNFDFPKWHLLTTG